VSICFCPLITSEQVTDFHEPWYEDHATRGQNTFVFVLTGKKNCSANCDQKITENDLNDCFAFCLELHMEKEGVFFNPDQ
jgi:hypothetical protein